MNRKALPCLMALTVLSAQGCVGNHGTIEITGCPDAGTTVAVGEAVTFAVTFSQTALPQIIDEILLTVGFESGDAELTLSTDGTAVVVPSAAGTITIVFLAMLEDSSAQEECTFEASAE